MFSILIRTNNKFKSAFTLAEVLITLGIIGVVAALVIPILVQNAEKQEYITALKKAYTETNQALIKMAADYGCTGDLKCTELFNSDTTNQSLGDAFVKYFHVVKNCKTATEEGCWIHSTNYNYDGSSPDPNNYIDSVNVYKFITSDGMSFAVINNSDNCTTSDSTGRSGNMAQVCGKIIIDLNGLKKPNAYGRDTFLFYITNGKGPLLYPDGGADDNSGGNDQWWKTTGECGSHNKGGLPCAGRVMEESWQMNY